MNGNVPTVPYTYVSAGALRFAQAVDDRESHYRTIDVRGKTWAELTVAVQTKALEIYVAEALAAMGRPSPGVKLAFALAQRLLERFDFGVQLPDEPNRLLQLQRVANGAAKLAYAQVRERDWKKHYLPHWPRPTTWTGVNQDSDRLFAHLRLAGMNPVSLRTAKDLAHVLACADQAKVEAALGEDLGAAIAAQRILVVDPSAFAFAARWQADRLAGAEPEHPHEPRFLRYPTAVFVVRNRWLEPLAIRFGEHHRTIIPTDGELWRRAKLHFGAAEAVYQTYVSHLPQTHFVMEAVVLASRRIFGFDPHTPAAHPAGRLLEPHFEGTLAVNETARATLLRTSSPFAQFIAPDLGSLEELVQGAFAERTAKGKTFRTIFGPELPDDTKLEYPFHTDFAKLAECLRAWVDGYVRRHWGSDAAVAADAKLQEWGVELRSPAGANIECFPAIDTLDRLIAALATIVQLATIQHAAFHFPQTDIGRNVMLAPFYVAEVEPGLAPAAAEANVTRLASLPDLHAAAWQSFVLGQSEVRWRTLPDLLAHPALAGEVGTAHAQAFAQTLVKIDAQIMARNDLLQAAGLPRYEYLRPANVPCSINV